MVLQNAGAVGPSVTMVAEALHHDPASKVVVEPAYTHTEEDKIVDDIDLAVEPQFEMYNAAAYRNWHSSRPTLRTHWGSCPGTG